MRQPPPSRPPLASTRRTFLRRSILAATAAVAGPSLLAACGRRAPDSGATGERRLVISNYPIYIDPSEDGVPGSVERFSKQTGIAVTYREDLNDAQTFFAKVQPDLAAGRPIAQDLVVVPYWLAERLIRLGWVEALPLEQVPNARNLMPSLRNPSWDPQQRHSLPWQSGIAGIAYNLEVTGRELKGVDDLFASDLRGKVGFLTEMRDTLGLLMLADGQDISRPTWDTAQASFDRMQKARESGQIRAFTGNDYQDDLLAGNFAACIAWSGDVAQLVLEQPKLRFLVPETGGVLWADVMVMPRGARNRQAVAEWLNWVYDPENAARIAASVQYISPVQGVQEILAADPATKALATNPQMFPDAAMQQRLRVFGPLSSEEEARFDERFARISQA
ncbi:PotD/PotF family extracellular solute-binding protein [Synechococcus sp. CBW1004]|uniref:ABC transporter substrate-binding protein n=1 Tax=Synechococcus sp. CBW1004 TaxID=1353136 RepID=UPI0018CEFDEB|nr:spermidine/putrescine ABC transporter substrate-binding protein [Synechococcus sp. CBW1004]QPN63233.1 spermidine/putrescine ABC transporter substrate-binding protein [Synechococcus sp. CBW1004]